MVDLELLFLLSLPSNVSTTVEQRVQNSPTNPRRNIPNIIIYGALELSYIFNCASHFALADGNASMGTNLTKASGAFGFVSALAGYYMLCHGLCQGALPFTMPLCETERFFRGRRPVGKEM